MKRFLPLFVIVFITGILAGCVKNATEKEINPLNSPINVRTSNENVFGNPEASGYKSSKKKIGVVLKALDSEHWLTIKKGAEKAADEENIDIAVLAPDKETDVEQQFRIIEDLIQQKVDALVIAPCDSTAVKAYIEKANQAHIPVFTVDENVVGNANIVSFAGTDNKIGGKMAGKRIIKILNGKGKVALISGSPGQKTHKDRAEGFKTELIKAPDIKLVAEQSAYSESVLAMTAMENILKAHPDLNAVFCTSALMSLGAMEAIDEKGKTGKVKIVGFDTQTDALYAIQLGKIDSMIAQDPYNMGYQTIKNAVKYLKGEQVIKVIDTATDLITKENLDKYVN